MPIKTTDPTRDVLGAGQIFFDAGDGAGERYLGQTPEFTITTEVTSLDRWTADGPRAEISVSVDTQTTRTATVVCNGVQNENLALFFNGEVKDESQAAETGAEDTVVVSPGRSYQLGKSDDNPVGVMDISNVTVTDTTSSTAYTAGTDYEVDAELGRVVILEDGAIAAETEVDIAYDAAAITITKVATTDAATVPGTLRFLADNSTGKNRNLVAPQVKLSPSGDFALKSREDYQQLTFEITIEKPNNGQALHFYEKKEA